MIPYAAAARATPTDKPETELADMKKDAATMAKQAGIEE